MNCCISLNGETSSNMLKVVLLSLTLLCSAYCSSELSVICSPEDTLIPNPDDCSSFYSCDNGIPRLTPCPPNLHFNPEALVCDRPENAHCQSDEQSTPKPTTTSTKPSSSTSTTTPLTTTTTRPTTTTTPKPSSSTTTTPKPSSSTTTTTPKPSSTTTSTQPTSTSTTPSPTTAKPSSTTTTLQPTTTTARPSNPSTTDVPNTTTTIVPPTKPNEPYGCPVNGSDIIANPSDPTCGTFLVCINGANTTLYCPNGMIFDEDTKACGNPDSVICRITTTELTTQSTTSIPSTTETPSYKPNCPEEGIAILENPESCSSFYVCVNGNSGLIQCPDGFNYNPLSAKCDLPEDPFCRGGNTEEPPTTPDPYVPPCPENGTIQLSNPDDCTSFYICINGNYAKLSCPDNFKFNETLQNCVHPELSTCQNREAQLLFQCEEDGTFPDPEDCSSYYVCVGNQAILMHCPGGLHFDTQLGSCNTPELAQCELGSSSDSPSSSTSTSTSSQPTAPTLSTETPSIGTQPPSTITPAPTTNSPNEPNCPKNGTAILPKPDDCTQFIVCIDGQYDVIDCPPGYAFNEDIGRCDLAENVECGTSVTPPPYQPSCPQNGTAKLPNPQDCGSYYYCINGQSALILCPEGLNYDKETETCTATAECSLSTPVPDSTTSSPKPPSTQSTENPTTEDPTSIKPTSVPNQCTEDGQLLPNPNSCTSFFKCANGEPVEIECPPGLEFNAEQLICDHPSEANCSVGFPKKIVIKFLRYLY